LPAPKNTQVEGNGVVPMRKPGPTRKLVIELLEDRTLLTSRVALNAATGILTIRDTRAGDQTLVSLALVPIQVTRGGGLPLTPELRKAHRPAKPKHKPNPHKPHHRKHHQLTPTPISPTPAPAPAPSPAPSPPRDVQPPTVFLQTPMPGLVTNTNITVTGRVTDDLSGPASAQGQLPGSAPFDVPLAPDGTFSFVTGLPLDSSADGMHTVRVRATDQAGNTSEFAEVTFTLDTVAPDVPVFDLGAGFDTAPVGDRRTSFATVTLTGRTSPGTQVRLVPTDAVTTSDAAGAFAFPGVSLAAGANAFTAQATDAAGNTSSFDCTVTRADVPAGTLTLAEGTNFLTQATVPVVLGQQQGTRKLRFDLEASFDHTDVGAAVEDVFSVYLVDPADPAQTLLDRGTPGTALFSLAGDHVELAPGLVRYDGASVEIDVTGLGGRTDGLLVLQLINSDTDTGSLVQVGPVTNVVDPNGSPVSAVPAAVTEVPAGPALDPAGLAPSASLRPLVENVRADAATGRYTADLRVRNEGPAAGRQVAVVFPALPAGVQVFGASGTDATGAPYLNFHDAIPPGGLVAGAASDVVRLVLNDPSLARFALRPAVLAGPPNRAPVFAGPIGPLSVMPGGRLEVPLTATDPDGDAVTFRIVPNGPLATGILTAAGTLVFTPTAAEAGSYTFTLAAGDGALETTQTVSLEVPVDAVNTTRISGVIEDTAGQPLAGVPIELGSLQTITAADGAFTITLPPEALPAEAFDIPVPQGDPQFDPFNTGTQIIPFRRARFDPLTGTDPSNPLQHPNLVSTFLDASMVYGSDPVRAAALRANDGTGRLKTSPGDLMPFNTTAYFPNGPLSNDNSGPGDPGKLFVAGDTRANENVPLMILHTVLLREHNRLADQIHAAEPGLTDEAIYQQARRLVGAIVEQITYNEYLPLLLGPDALTPYTGYKPDADPSVSALFSTVAFRLGHTQLLSPLPRLGSDGNPLPGDPLTLRTAFFNTQPVLDDGIDPVLRGLIATPAQRLDNQVIDEVRNFLFGPPGAGGLDLAAMNIQRARDMGLPGYNQARRDVGLPTVTSFAQISSDPAVQARLQSIYSDVEQVDAWVGGISEDHVAGALVGPLFQRILKSQFERVRDGDRFWYENAQLTADELAMVRATTLSSLLARTTGLTNLPADAFTAGAVNPGPAPAGSAAAVQPDEVRSIDGSGNNAADPRRGSAGTDLRVDYTVSYADGFQAPNGADRPNPRAISNAVVAQSASIPDPGGTRGLAVFWGQLLDHDLSLTPAGFSDTLKVHGEEVPGATFPSIAEKLDLLLEHPVLPGVNNVIGRPIFLPAVDTANGQHIDPTRDMTVTTPAIPGAAVHVKAGTLQNRDGSAFTGVLSITEVPRDLTPAALPPGLLPDLVVTIQPGEMVFTQPAPLTLPNLSGWAPGAPMELWSINPITGHFDKVGDARVSADGTVVETVSGGIRNSSWHFVTCPRAKLFDETEDNTCKECKAEVQGNSSVELGSGALLEAHALVSYQSLGVPRGLTLRYDSLRADPRPTVRFRMEDVDPATFSVPSALKMAARVSIQAGGITYQAPGAAKAQGLQGGENFWSLPGAGTFRAGLQLDLRSLPSGRYPYKLEGGVLGFSGARKRYIGSLNSVTGSLLHVNGTASPFGAGWGLAGLDELVIDDDGSVLLIDGDGGESLFAATTPGQPYQSPPGDFSTLERLPDATFRRTLTDQTVYTFNALHKQASVRDRNGNETRYAYDAAGRLITITDPAGLVTTFDYTAGRVTTITDPAGRTTLLEYDAAGNLIRVTDPDGSQSAWDYDGMHHMTGQTDPRGNQAQVTYDFAGRITQEALPDGTTLRFQPFQTYGLYPADQTSSASKAPLALRPAASDTSYTDGNGNGTRVNLDRAGQRVSSTDAIGPGPTVTRNSQNLVTLSVDPRGNPTRFEYDGRGNVLAIDDSTGPSGGPIGIVEPGWALTRQIAFAGGQSAVFNPRDGLIYVARRSGTGQGVYRIEANGTATFRVGSSQPAALLVDPKDGDTFIAEDFLGQIFRMGFGQTVRDPWVTTFHAGDADPVGMAIAPSDYTGPVLSPGQALVVDRGFNGPDEVWLFSPDQPDGFFTKKLVHADDGTLINAVDITITPTGIYLVDTGEENGGPTPGTIYRLEAGGRLVALTTSEPLPDPVGITYDPLTGDLLVLDNVDGRLVRVNPDTGVVRPMLTGFTIAQDGWTGVDISADGSQIVVTDGPQGKLYVFTRNPTVGLRRTFTYDPTFSQLTSMTDELGHETLFDVDPANGNLRSTTRVVGAVGGADDVVTRFTYTPQGLVSTVTDALGRVTAYEYDTLGRLTRVTQARGTPDEGVRQFEYDANTVAGQAGNMTAVIDENGNRTEYQYDKLNRLVRTAEADPDGPGPLTSPVTAYTYDPAGNLETMLDAQGNLTRYQYDSRNRLTRVTDANQQTTLYGYDMAGNRISMVDPLGHTTLDGYDSRDRQVLLVDPDGGRTQQRYDPNDNLTAVIDPVGNQTQFLYDFRNRLIQETDPLGKQKQYSYDTANNLVRTVDRNGREVRYEYDDLNRRTSESWVGTTEVINSAYDKMGNLLSVTDPFSSLAFTYDNRDRVQTVDNTGTPGVPPVVLTYTYDPTSNVLSVSDTIGGQPGAVTAYEYDALHRMDRVTQSGSGVQPKRVDLAYNSLGQFDSIRRYSDLAGTQLVVASQYQYDALNRLTSLTHNNATSTVAFYNFSYDGASRITRITDVDGVTDYTYDSRDQLTGADHSAAANPDESYAYDANGNRISSHIHGNGYQTGPGNRLLSDGTFNYAYDDEGNLIRRTEITTGKVREFTWDYRNRLVSVTDKDASGTATQVVTFGYDALDRRISKAVDTTPGDPADVGLTLFVYDRGDVILDFTAGDDSGSTPPVLAQRYLRGPAADLVFAQEDGTGTTRWQLTDHLGTVRDLVDGNGATVNHVRYDSFGNVIGQTSPLTTGRYLFTGREFDIQTGLYYYRARYYAADMGRFIGEDPLGVAGPDSNAYRYVKNGPVSFLDPQGLQATSSPLTFLDPQTTDYAISDCPCVDRHNFDKAYEYAKDKLGKMGLKVFEDSPLPPKVKKVLLLAIGVGAYVGGANVPLPDVPIRGTVPWFPGAGVLDGTLQLQVQAHDRSTAFSEVPKTALEYKTGNLQLKLGFDPATTFLPSLGARYRFDNALQFSVDVKPTANPAKDECDQVFNVGLQGRF
jgi:RHS repeat-associated protein